MGNCVVCDQQITNPLSPERLAEQIKTWLAETKPQLIPVLEEKTEEFLPMHSGEDRCIVTGKRMNVCPYCYTEHIFNWLISLKLESSMLAEFMTFFHFDEGKLGYYRRAEALGVSSL